MLLGTRGASTLSPANSNAATDATATVAKFIPLIRRLLNEPRVTTKANEVIARLSERIVSRGLRAAFGLPEPAYESDDLEKSSKNNLLYKK